MQQEAFVYDRGIAHGVSTIAWAIATNEAPDDAASLRYVALDWWHEPGRTACFELFG